MTRREIPPEVVEIPDLDVLPGTGRLPRTQRGSNRTGSEGIHLESFEFSTALDDDLLGSSLDLALQDNSTQQLTAPEARVSGDGRWPTGTSPEPGAAIIDPAQVQPLCGWGPAPTAFWAAPIYAYLVLNGRHDLLRQIKPVTHELRQLESQRDACLGELAVTLKDKLSSDPRYHVALQSLHTSEAVYEQATSQLQQAEDRSAQEQASLHQSIDAAEAQLTKLQTQLDIAKTASQEAATDLKRQQAKYQRLRIERRNLELMDPQAPGSAQRTGELDQQAENLVTSIESKRQLERTKHDSLQQLERSVFEKQAELDLLRCKPSAANGTRAAKHDEACVAVTAAMQQRDQAMANLGRAILAARGRTPVQPATLDEIARFDEGIATLWLREQMYLCALDSYDKRAVRRGLIVATTCLALMLVALVWRVVSALAQ